MARKKATREEQIAALLDQIKKQIAEMYPTGKAENNAGKALAALNRATTMIAEAYTHQCAHSEDLKIAIEKLNAELAA